MMMKKKMKTIMMTKMMQFKNHLRHDSQSIQRHVVVVCLVVHLVVVCLVHCSSSCCLWLLAVVVCSASMYRMHGFIYWLGSVVVMIIAILPFLLNCCLCCCCSASCSACHHLLCHHCCHHHHHSNLTGFYPQLKYFLSCRHMNYCQHYMFHINLHIIYIYFFKFNLILKEFQEPNNYFKSYQLNKTEYFVELYFNSNFNSNLNIKLDFQEKS